MSHEPNKGAPKPIKFLFEYSGFLIFGAIAALVWANVDPDVYEGEKRTHEGTYSHFIHFEFQHLFYDPPPEDHHVHLSGNSGSEDEPPHDNSADTDEPKKTDAVNKDKHKEHHHPFNIEFFVNDVLMAFFFAIAAKEVWEALLPGGPLANPRKAATPLLATFGGIVGPAGLYCLAVLIMGQWGELGKGWAIPCATDIAFCYLVARLIFGTGHPAIAFLLLLAIVDDAAGLVIIAVAYPSGDLNLIWLLLAVGAVLMGIGLRYLRVTNFWWYLLIPGALSWVSFYMAGIHAALGLVPVVFTMPSANSDLGLFAQRELNREDTLNAFEHWWKNPVEIFLGLFGLVNAGVVLSSFGYGTAWVLLGLLVGKPLGITLFTFIGQRFFGLQIPGGMTYRHILTLGMVAGIGFTVALFVSAAAFGGNNLSVDQRAILDAAKMGALLSFAAAVLGFGLGRILGIKPGEHGQADAGGEDESPEPA